MTLLPVTPCKLVSVADLRIHIVMCVNADESPIPESASQWFALTRRCPMRSALLPLRPTRAPQHLRRVILDQAATACSALGSLAYHQLLTDTLGASEGQNFAASNSDYMWKTLLNHRYSHIEPADLTKQ